MTFWLDRGWLWWLPTEHPGLNFLGSAFHTEDPNHGGFRRITGFGDGWLRLLALDNKQWRLSFDPEDFVDTGRLAPEPVTP